MELIDNINIPLGDDFKMSLMHGSQLKVAPSCFSIYAYEALKIELDKIASLKFSFASLTFTTSRATDKVKRKGENFTSLKLAAIEVSKRIDYERA